MTNLTADHDMRDGFFNKLIEILKVNKKIIILTNDYGSPALDKIKIKFPNNILNLGITEQNIVSVSSGLASRGFLPILYSISTFITRRAYEQLLLDIGVMKLPVVLLGVGSGYAYSMDGPTHHAFEDLALIKSIPGSRIFTPSDNSFFEKLDFKFFNHNNLTYLRLDRGYKPIYLSKLNNFCSYKDYNFIRSNSNNCLITYGGVTQIVITNNLIKNYDLIDIQKVNPLPNGLITKLKKYKKIKIIEEHIFTGSLYSDILKQFNKAGLVATKISSSYLEKYILGYGSRAYLHKKNKLY